MFHQILSYLVVFLSITCSLSCQKELEYCQSKMIGEWNVNEHFLYNEFDSVHSEYSSVLELVFYANGSGISYRTNLEEDFEWECSDTAITFYKDTDHSLYLDHGEYTIIDTSDISITLQRYQHFEGRSFPSGDSINYDSWRTWILTKK